MNDLSRPKQPACQPASRYASKRHTSRDKHAPKAPLARRTRQKPQCVSPRSAASRTFSAGRSVYVVASIQNDRCATGRESAVFKSQAYAQVCFREKFKKENAPPTRREGFSDWFFASFFRSCSLSVDCLYFFCPFDSHLSATAGMV